MQLIQKQFNNQIVTFDLTSDMMISLTDMAKANGKRTNDWLSLQSTKDYLSALSKSNTAKSGSEAKQELITVNGGKTPGTWATKRVAIRFAQWLSDEFAIWVDTQIEELMTSGSVALKPLTRKELLLLALAAEEKVEAAEEARAKATLERNAAIDAVNQTGDTLFYQARVLEARNEDAKELRQTYHRK